MKITSLKVAPFLAAIAMFMTSCGGDTPSDSSDNALNLLTNSSFENANNQPDFSGWKSSVYITDSLGNRTAPLVQDAPSDGGKWCVQLMPEWNIGHAVGDITGQSGTNIYKISAWIKTNGWKGELYLLQYRSDVLIDKKMINDTTHSWKHISFSDTLTVQPMDTLRIYLSAGYSQFSREKKVWFDNIKFEKVN